MLSRDPRKRPSAATLLRDQFFSNRTASTAAYEAKEEATAARVAAQAAGCVPHKVQVYELDYASFCACSLCDIVGAFMCLSVRLSDV